MGGRRSLAGRWAVALLLLSLLLVLLAFCTQNWLASDSRFRGAKLQRMGLWVHCFRSLPSPGDPSQRLFFSGCRWLFDGYTAGYAEIRSYLTPPFFVAVQLFYTLTFMCSAGAGALLLVMLLCVDEDKDPKLLRIMSLLMGLSGLFGLLSVAVFGAMGRSYAWTSDTQHNYLSWSYGLAVLGVFIQLIVAVLLVNDARVCSKRHQLASSQSRHLDQM